MAHVDIVDLGTKRKVHIYGEAYSYGDYSPDGLEFETTSSVGLLRDIERIKGTAWLKDEIDRAECPDYLEVPLRRLIGRFIRATDGLEVLDIGSGVGASSIILARMGMRATAVECDKAFHDVAVRRVQECGLGDQVRLKWIERTAQGLPFADGAFDVIMLSAVVEHVHPKDRPALLAEAWRVLKPGGHLFIHDTPNRLWPYDGHTTGLWFPTWLPWKLRVSYARRFSRRFHPDISEGELISKGLDPPTYWEIEGYLPGALCLNKVTGNDVSFVFGLTGAKHRPLHLAMTRTSIIAFLKFVGRLVSLLHAPPAAILQNLDLCFQKP